MADEVKTPPENKDGENKPAMTKDDAVELKSAIAGLNGGLKELLTFAQRRAEAEEQNNAATTTEEETEEQNPDEDTLESMNRAQFGDFLLLRFKKHLDTTLKPVLDGVQNASLEAQRTNLEVQAREFANKTPDFADWEHEMIAIAKESPNLSINRIYALARAENPQKAQEIDKKLAEAKKKTGESQKEPPAPPRRQRASDGLSPGGTSGESKNSRMNPTQAAQAAWEEAVARFGNPFA